MSQIPSLLEPRPATDQPFGEHNTLNDLDLDVFLKLLITELQNQDPLNPMDNTRDARQINQIREIGATDKLTGTLDSVLLGQNIASSTNLIGADVKAISDDNQQVSGTVSRVSIEDGKPKLQLDLGDEGRAVDRSRRRRQGRVRLPRRLARRERQLEGIELSGRRRRLDRQQHQRLPVDPAPQPADHRRCQSASTAPTRAATGDYRLVATLTDGTQSSYLDTTADDDRSETRQTRAVQQGRRDSASAASRSA